MKDGVLESLVVGAAAGAGGLGSSDHQEGWAAR